ncbi:hypothetical protein JXA47_00145 [Candidatus Sumerlaeota bacterium]|nr:hypothetical protein [Candidatus Sumerlaeota bacterium]
MLWWSLSLCLLVVLYALITGFQLWRRDRGQPVVPRLWRRGWPIFTLALVGPALAVFSTNLISALRFSEPLLLVDSPNRTISQYNWAVVIGRRPERRSMSDASTPFRNSPLALYERTPEGWVKREGDLVCRSTSTSESPPTDADQQAVLSFARDRGVVYRWGQVSVPLGCYNLTPRPWRGDTTAFTISELYGFDGQINLEEPQVLTTSILVTDESTGEWVLGEDPTRPPVTSYIKMGCHIHASTTTSWSHRDSLGCINLYSGDDGDGASDYQEFMAWLESRGLLNEPLALVIADYVDIAGSVAELPGRLTLEGLD